MLGNKPIQKKINFENNIFKRHDIFVIQAIVYVIDVLSNNEMYIRHCKRAKIRTLNIDNATANLQHFLSPKMYLDVIMPASS